MPVPIGSVIHCEAYISSPRLLYHFCTALVWLHTIFLGDCSNMKAPLCAKAVETEVKVYPGLQGAIFHLDRGSQCTSWLYRRTIQKTGLIQSMNNAQRALSWQFTLREHVNRNEGGAILYRLDSWKISVEQLKEMVWWYFYSNWNNHHNHRICSTNGRLPPMVRRQCYYYLLQQNT